MRAAFLCLVCVLSWIVHSPTLAASAPAPDEGRGWTLMPAGARPAYMGIHGGTMPVSLLVVADGSSLLGFAGRTGNDFLDMLRNAELPFFSNLLVSNEAAEPDEIEFFGYATNPGGTTRVFDRASLGAASVFVTGQGAVSLPVIQINSGLAGLPLTLEQLLPFGFSDKPLPLEGQVTQPAKSAPVRQYRLVFEPQYLQPRRSK